MFEQRDGMLRNILTRAVPDLAADCAQRPKLASGDLRRSAAMLREFGNLSSAFVYFVLEAALADEAPPGWWWLSSFGAGFSCHGALMEVQ